MITNEQRSSVASLSNSGAYHLADMANLYEPQRTNNFVLYVDGIDSLTRSGDYAESTLPDNVSEALTLSVKSCTVPSMSQNVIEVNKGNTTIKYAGTMSFGSGTIVINDYVGVEARDALFAWQRLSGDVMTEYVGWAADYKKDITLLEYTPDYKLVASWVIKGAWLSEVKQDDFTNDSNNVVSVSATFQYDKAYLDVTAAQNNAGIYAQA